MIELLTTTDEVTNQEVHIHRPRPIRPRPVGAVPSEIDVRDFSFFYGNFKALDSINLRIPRGRITALIGASGSGKSTLLRAMNRMHDNIIGAHAEGEIVFNGENVLQSKDLIQLRKQIGMIFQRSTVFPMSIRENIAYGLKLRSQRVRGKQVERRVEEVLHSAALWEEVRDKLDKSGLALSGGQQQRLCIARAIAVQPSVLLMDEPCAALDPISTRKVEDLMHRLKGDITIVIVTHNMQQAARVADYTAFMNMDPETRAGQLIEFGVTKQIFDDPRDPRTEAYISGKFG
jgi:phosphate transport system ATP-binding protein